MLKFAAATSSNFKREFEVRNCLRHVAELKAKVDVSNHIVSGVFRNGHGMANQREDD